MFSNPPSGGIFKSLGYVVEKAAGTDAAPVFRITSEVLDRAHDRMIGIGGKADNFARNPVLLWNHDRKSPAIGTAKVYKDASGQWLMEPVFDGIGQLSQEVAAKVKAGTLRTCSIGFIGLKHAHNDEGGFDVLEWDLLEVSITNIPANPEAERVKNAPTQAPPPHSTKALEEGDLDAVAALMEQKLAPVLEALGKVQSMCEKLMQPEEPEPAAEPAPAPQGEAAAKQPPVPPGEDEAKSFIHYLSGRRR